MKSRFLGYTLAVLALTALGCNSVVDPSQNIQVPFSGTLSQGGPAQPFTVSIGKNGEYSVSITSEAPSTPVLGTEWGLSGLCTGDTTQLIAQNNFSTLNNQALGGAVQSGNYCVIVYDSGGLSSGAKISFTVTVSHP
jgi:hypothetical protein